MGFDFLISVTGLLVDPVPNYPTAVMQWKMVRKKKSKLTLKELCGQQ